MRQMNRSEQVTFGNWLLEKHGVDHQVTGEEIQEFYEKMGHGQPKAEDPVLDAEKSESSLIDDLGQFTFPDDLDKIEVKPAVEESKPDGKKKGAAKKS